MAQSNTPQALCQCNEGRLPCSCGRPPAQPIPRAGMWDDELRQPVLYALLYLGTLFAAILASHLAAVWGTP